MAGAVGIVSPEGVAGAGASFSLVSVLSGSLGFFSDLFDISLKKYKEAVQPARLCHATQGTLSGEFPFRN